MFLFLQDYIVVYSLQASLGDPFNVHHNMQICLHEETTRKIYEILYLIKGSYLGNRKKTAEQMILGN